MKISMNFFTGLPKRKLHRSEVSFTNVQGRGITQKKKISLSKRRRGCGGKDDGTCGSVCRTGDDRHR